MRPMTETEKTARKIARALYKAEQRVEDLRRQWVAARNAELREQHERRTQAG